MGIGIGAASDYYRVNVRGTANVAEALPAVERAEFDQTTGFLKSRRVDDTFDSSTDYVKVDFTQGTLDGNGAPVNRFKWAVDKPGKKMFFVGWAVFGLILYRLYGYRRSRVGTKLSPSVSGLRNDPPS